MTRLPNARPVLVPNQSERFLVRGLIRFSTLWGFGIRGERFAAGVWGLGVWGLRVRIQGSGFSRVIKKKKFGVGGLEGGGPPDVPPRELRVHADAHGGVGFVVGLGDLHPLHRPERLLLISVGLVWFRLCI